MSANLMINSYWSNRDHRIEQYNQYLRSLIAFAFKLLKTAWLQTKTPLYKTLILIDVHINNIGQSDIIKQRLFQITYSMYMHKHKIITFCNKMNHRKHRNRNFDVSAPILNTHSRVNKYQVKSF